MKNIIFIITTLYNLYDHFTLYDPSQPHSKYKNFNTSVEHTLHAIN